MKTRKVISILILSFLVITFGYYIKKHTSEFKQLSLVEPGYIILLVLIVIIFAALGGLITKYVLRRFDINLSWKEWFGLSVTTSFYNLITIFGGGMFSRALYLKRRYHLLYSDFISSLSGIYIINFLAASIVGLMSVCMLYFYYDTFSIVIFLAFLGIMTLSLGIILLPYKKLLPKKEGYITNRLYRLFIGWDKVRNDKKLIFIISLIFIFQILLGAFSTLYSFRAFGTEVNFVSALFLASMSTIGLIVTITPANLGIAETITVFSATTIGITPAQALSATLLGRAVSLIVLFILGPIFSYTLMRKKNERQD